MAKKILVFVFILLFASFMQITAQTVYPAEADVFLSPPYSPVLTTYIAAASNKMSAQLILKESKGGVPVNVRIRVIVEDKYSGRQIATRSSYIPPKPIILQPGMPYLMSAPDIEPYLRPDNLQFQGIDVNQFLNDKKLPEGTYTFRIEILEYYRGVVISDPVIGSKTVMIVENAPPTWVLPATAGPLTIDARDPQVIMFSWLPKQMGSFSAQYTFTMVEMPNANADPNAAFLSIAPLFTTTTTSTSLIYDISAPQLIPGRTYVCQVTAGDPDNLGLFTNDGKSALLVFTWGQTCSIPSSIAGSAESLTSEKIIWVSANGNTSFEVQYREVTDSTSSDYYTDEVSYDGVSTNVSHTIAFLKAGHTYECEVQAICESVNSGYSALFTFTTAPKPQTTTTNTCGQTFSSPYITDKTPIAKTLVVGDTINIGGFIASLTEVTGNGTSGFSGKCVVNTSTLGIRIKSHFTNIFVNDKQQVYSGNIIGDYDPKNLVDLDQLQKDATTIATLAQQTQLELKAMVDDVKSYLATDPTMIDIMFDLDTAKNIPDATRVSLENINQGIKDEQKAKQLIQQGNVAAGDSLLQVARKEKDEGKQGLKEQAGFSTDKITDRKVVFSADQGQLYGFDNFQYTQLSNYYEHYYDAGHNAYGYPWKSLPTGGNDVVDVDLSGLSKDSVVFMSDNNQTQLLSNNKLSITTSGNYVKAYQKHTGSNNVAIGKLNLVKYDLPTPINVVVVKVNGATADITGLQNALDTIYKKAVMSFTVNSSDTITVTGLNPTFAASGVATLSNYTDDMNTVIDAYKTAHTDITHETYYLFLVNGSNSDRSGFMPLSRQWGFVFTDKISTTAELYRTIAHELGHGAFRLRHTFSADLGSEAITQGTTNNLMDYPSANDETATALWKNQWDNIHSPAFGLYFFQDEKEGASVNIVMNNNLVDTIIKTIRASNFSDKGTSTNSLSLSSLLAINGSGTRSIVGAITISDTIRSMSLDIKYNNGALKITNPKNFTIQNATVNGISWVYIVLGSDNNFRIFCKKSNMIAIITYIFSEIPSPILVTWVSQLDAAIETISTTAPTCHWCSDWTSCTVGKVSSYNTCCAKTCVYMLNQMSKPVYLSTQPKIFTASLNNTDSLSKGITCNSIDDAVAYIDGEILNKGNPVMIGVYESPWPIKLSPKPYNYLNNGITHSPTTHFMVIVAKGTDKLGDYYRFYDPGRTESGDGASSSNKLRINRTSNKISINPYRGKEYILTEVRKNK